MPRAALLQSISFGEHVGPARLAGNPAPDVSDNVAVSASEVWVAEDVPPDVLRSLARKTPVPVARDRGDIVSLAILSEIGNDAIDRIETVLRGVCREGLFLLDVPMPALPEARRARRFIEAACLPGVIDGSETGRLSILGRRKHGEPMPVTENPSAALPVSVVVWHDASTPMDQAAETLVDVLVRPWLPPMEVFVLDGAPLPSKLPTNLFGIRPSPLTKVALFPKRRKKAITAINDAIGGVAAPLVAIVRTGSRLGPNAHAVLGLALERRAAAMAAVGWRPDEGQASEDGVPLESMLFRAEVLREGGVISIPKILGTRASRGRHVVHVPLQVASIITRSPLII